MKIKNFLLYSSILAGGTILSQALLTLASPWLTRIYDLEDFGQYGIYSGILGIVLVVASLRYELLIPLSRNNRRSTNVAVLSVLINFIFASILLIISFCIDLFLVKTPFVVSVSEIAVLLPLGVFVGGLNIVLSALAIRKKVFKHLQTAKLVQIAVAILVQLSMGDLGWLGLVSGEILGQLAGVVILFVVLPGFYSGNYVTVKRMWIIAIRFKEFPIFSTWEGLVNAAGSLLPSVIIGSLFGPSNGGAYVMANRVVQVPFSIIGNAFSQILIAVASEAKSSRKIASLFQDLHRRLSIIAAIPLVVITLWGPEIFGFGFGEKWETAGRYGRYMALWMFFVLTVSPFTCLFALLELQSFALRIQIIMTSARVLALWIGYKIGGAKLAVLMFSSGSAACWLLMLFYLCNILSVPIRAVLYKSISAIVMVLICLIPLVIVLNLKVGAFINCSFVVGSVILLGFVTWKGLIAESC
jgi:O-antigen/teichoic acid export membrane protein